MRVGETRWRPRFPGAIPSRSTGWRKQARCRADSHPPTACASSAARKWTAIPTQEQSWQIDQDSARPRPGSTSESAQGAAAPATRLPWFGASRFRQRRHQARPTGSPIGRATTAARASRDNRAGGDAPPPALRGHPRNCGRSAHVSITIGTPICCATGVQMSTFSSFVSMLTISAYRAPASLLSRFGCSFHHPETG